MPQDERIMRNRAALTRSPPNTALTMGLITLPFWYLWMPGQSYHIRASVSSDNPHSLSCSRLFKHPFLQKS